MIALLFVTLTYAALTPEALVPQNVRVRLQADLHQVEIQGRALLFQNRPLGPATAEAPKGFEKLLISKTSVGGKIVWVLEKNGTLHLVHGPSLTITGKDLSVNGHRVPNEILLSPAPSKIKSPPINIELKPSTEPEPIDVLAALDLEKYLEGVLPSEMSPSWPLEALKAQAVAARTYALFRRSSRETRRFDLESTVDDQVYTYVPRNSKGRVHRAIQETRGQILLTKDQTPFAAYFHSDCGGSTDSPRAIWRQQNEGKAVTDSFCLLNPSSEWRYTLTRAQIMDRLKRHGQKWFQKLKSGSQIQSFEIAGRMITGRVTDVTATFTKGEKIKLTGEDFRRLLGHRKLKSTRFEMRERADAFVFVGRGYGHGVGMCQHGARALALEGKNHEQIVAHYYPEAHLSTSRVTRKPLRTEYYAGP